MPHDHADSRKAVGPFVRAIVTLCCVLIASTAAVRSEQPFVTIEGDTDKIAWWVLADFHPFTTEVRGIPVSKIRKGWCKATEFRKDLLPREFAIDKSGKDALEGYSFAVEGSFDGSAVKQVALVGVYEECSGQRGRFFMILDQPKIGPPRIRFLDAFQTENQFGMLELMKGNTLLLWSCMDCDGYAKLTWDRKRRRFKWLSPDF